MELWVEALLLGLLSGASLPIGAYLGDKLSPVRQDVVAGMMAFGAGALLFAVTVELYGQSLHEVEHHKTMRDDAATSHSNGTGSAQHAHAMKDAWRHHSEAYDVAKVAISLTVFAAAIGALGYLWLSKKLDDYMMSQPSAPADAAAEAGRAESTPLTEAQRTSAQGHWRTAASRVRMAVTVASPVKSGRARALVMYAKTKEEVEADDDKAHEVKVAYAMWLGVLVDGIPEGALLGFLAAQRSLSMALVLSLLVANFPEAFSAASIMKEAGISRGKILGMWTSLCVITGVLCALACYMLMWFVPDGKLSAETEYVIASVEGIAGGAMIACISAVMLPEAFERSYKESLWMSSGFLCTAGFLVSVLMKVFGG